MNADVTMSPLKP